MNDIDALLQMCLASPTDAFRRGVLADKLAELNESELEVAIRSDKGEQIIRCVYQLADSLKRTACLRLLWCVGVAGYGMPLCTTPTPEQADELQRSLYETIRRSMQRSVTVPHGIDYVPDPMPLPPIVFPDVRYDVNFPTHTAKDMDFPQGWDVTWTINPK